MRFIALKTGVFSEFAPARIYNLLSIRDLLVMRLAGIGLAQIAHPFGPRVCNHDVLVTVGFLLTTVVKHLFFRVFGALPPPFRSINEVVVGTRLLPFMAGESTRIAFGENSQLIQGVFENGQPPMNPVVGARLTESEEFTQHSLHRVRLLIHQCE